MKDDLEEIGRLSARVARTSTAACRPYVEILLGAVLFVWAAGTFSVYNGATGLLLVVVVTAAIASARIRPVISALFVVVGVVMLCVFQALAYVGGGITSDLFGFAIVALLIVCFLHARRALPEMPARIEALAHSLWPWLVASGLFGATMAIAPLLSRIYEGYGRLAQIPGSIPATLAGAAVACLPVLAVWLTGYTIRVRRERRADASRQRLTEEQLRNADLELLVTKERDRIAQDVHDIMAHSLSVIVAQADGARLIRESKPEAVDESLHEIAESARTSLTEVRMLIESLVNSPEGHSHPTLDNIEDLVERMCSAGLAVEYDTFGERFVLTPTQQLAVYRIVQEALTNALKHSGRSAHSRVTMDWRGLGLSLSIESYGDRSREPGAGVLAPEEVSSAGRGLYGMRERARLAGGWLTAGHDESSGRYVVTAYVPHAQDEPDDVSESREEHLTDALADLGLRGEPSDDVTEPLAELPVDDGAQK